MSDRPTEIVSVMVSPAEKERLVAVSKAEGRSLSNYCRLVVMDAVRAAEEEAAS